MIQSVVVGGTYEWLLNPALNTEASPGVFGAWNLTGATVTISFVPPSGGAQHFSATVLSDGSGAKYVNTTALFNVEGTWGVSWKVTNSGVVLESQINQFRVYPSGAAL
jgi:hypothetical protein